MISLHPDNVVAEYGKVRMDGESTSSPLTTDTTTPNSSLSHESKSGEVGENGDKPIVVLKEDVNEMTTATANSSSVSITTSISTDDAELETTSTPILFPVDLPNYAKSLENTQPSGQRKVTPSTLLKSSRNALSQQWRKVKKAVISLKEQVCYDINIEQV